MFLCETKRGGHVSRMMSIPLFVIFSLFLSFEKSAKSFIHPSIFNHLPGVQSRAQQPKQRGPVSVGRVQNNSQGAVWEASYPEH